MDLKEYLQVLSRRWLISVSVFALFLLLYYLFFFLPEIPLFTATSTVAIRIEPAPKDLREADIQQFYSTGFGYPTKEALIKSRKVYEYAAAVSLYSKVREFPKQKDPELLAKMQGEKILDEQGHVVMTDPLRAEFRALYATVVTSPPPERIQLVQVTATGPSREEAIRRANVFGRGAELYSRLESVETLQSARGKIDQEIRKLGDAMLAVQQRGAIDEERVDLRKREADALRSSLAQHEGQLESLLLERERNFERMRILLVRDHVDRTPLTAPGADTASSPMLERLRGDILGVRTDLAITGALYWQEAHPRRIELERRLVQLESESRKEIERLRGTELMRLQEREQELEVDKTNVELLRSQKLYQLNELEMFLRAEMPRVEELRKLRTEKERLELLNNRLGTTQELQQPFYDLHEPAEEATVSGSKWPRTMAVWILLALFLAVGAGFMVEYLDTNLYTDYDVRRHLNLACVGLIQKQDRGESPILLHLSPRSLLAERFNMAATILRSYMVERQFKSVCVCSAVPQEGKTTVAVNLAISMARKGLQVALVDSDLYRPQIHEIFGVPNSRGLSDLLYEGRGGREEVESALQATAEANLFVLPSGSVPASPVQLLESQAMVDLIRHLREACDVVLFDTPPITDISDTLTLAGRADTNLLVVGSGLTDRRRVTWAKQLLSNVRADLSGVLMNFVSRMSGGKYYYYYGSGYGSSGKSVREA